MTLLEMSVQYADSAALIRARIRELRTQERQQPDPAAARRLRQRIAALTRFRRECCYLAVWSERYYDSSYHKHERYTF